MNRIFVFASIFTFVVAFQSEAQAGHGRFRRAAWGERFGATPFCVESDFAPFDGFAHDRFDDFGYGVPFDSFGGTYIDGCRVESWSSAPYFSYPVTPHPTPTTTKPPSTAATPPRTIPAIPLAPPVYKRPAITSFEPGKPTPLFNGTDLSGWTDRHGNRVTEGWAAQDGEIVRVSKADNLYTTHEFDNFIFDFEFKISPGGNSGVKYMTWATEGWGMGCEYQVIDDTADPELPRVHQSGALYDMFEPQNTDKQVSPNEYHTGRIVVMGNYIEHWLDGVRTVATAIDSSEWKERVAESKFNDEPNFAHVRSGRFFLQDHGAEVHFRNMVVTELTPRELAN